MSGRKLGTDYEKAYIEKSIAENPTHSRSSQNIMLPKFSAKTQKSKPKNISIQSLYDKQNRTIGRLIDIQNNQKAQESPGYARWAKLHNLKLSAQTMNYLSDHNLLNPDDLAQSINSAKTAFSTASEALTSTQNNLASVRELKKQLSIYLKTKEIHAEYRKIKNKKQFLAEHEPELKLYDTAKTALKSSQPDGKLPTMKLLVSEEKELQSAKNQQYESYKNAKQLLVELQTLRNNENAIITGRRMQLTER